jgi:hypothetical protein
MNFMTSQSRYLHELQTTADPLRVDVICSRLLAKSEASRSL